MGVLTGVIKNTIIIKNGGTDGGTDGGKINPFGGKTKLRG